jgi:hypothetical protein
MGSLDPVIEEIHDHLVNDRRQQADGRPGHQCCAISAQLAYSIHGVAEMFIGPFYFKGSKGSPQK